VSLQNGNLTSDGQNSCYNYTASAVGESRGCATGQLVEQMKRRTVPPLSATRQTSAPCFHSTLKNMRLFTEFTPLDSLCAEIIFHLHEYDTSSMSENVDNPITFLEHRVLFVEWISEHSRLSSLLPVLWVTWIVLGRRLLLPGDERHRTSFTSKVVTR